VPSGIEPAPYTYAEFVTWYTGERERLGRIAQRARMQAD
jgi:hypothetical protein